MLFNKAFNPNWTTPEYTSLALAHRILQSIIVKDFNKI